MKNILRLEEAAMLALAIYLNSFLPFEGWVFWALFLLPDLGMLGYLVNAKVGAATYNLLHHKGIAIILYLVDIFWSFMNSHWPEWFYSDIVHSTELWDMD